MRERSRKGDLKKVCLVFTWPESRVWRVSHLSGKRNTVNKNINNNIDLKSCSVNLHDIASHVNSVNDLKKLCGNGKAKCIYKCKLKRCQMKNIFAAQDKVLSTCSKRIYDCIVPPGTVYIDCHTANVIYLITCSRCQLQYVGETVQKINERINWHKSCFRHPKKYSFCRILSDHFHKGICKNASFTVQIFEKLEGNGRTPRGALDPSMTSLRKQKERDWMLKLRTVYPYGMNDRIGDDFVNQNTHVLVGKQFPPLPRKNARISRGQSHRNNSSLSPKDFFHQFKLHLNNNLSELPNFSRVHLMSMKKANLRQIAVLLNECLAEANSSQYTHWYLMALDIIDSKILKPPLPAKKKTSPQNICKISFENKAIEHINLNRIFHDPVVKQAMPNISSNFDIPTVVYTLTNPIGSKIFNFNKFVNKLDVKAFLDDNSTLPCECSGSQFIDKDHNHVITGNLKIISNNKLRKLFSKGPKYRESKTINYNIARESILSGITSCIELWCNKHGVSTSLFSEWKQIITHKIDDRINNLKTTNAAKHHVPNTKLKETAIANELKHLHKKYVIVPIDKANGNVAFICQRHYAQVLIDELGINNINNNKTNTYINVTKSAEKIIADNTSFLKQKFKLEVDKTNQKLPNIYWTPKLHKNPSKSRFIIAAPKCSVKPLSKAVTAALKLLYKQIENYNYKTHYYSSVKTFWPIQSNQAVLQAIDKINSRNKAVSITTFDFSTLYTNISHHKLKSVMSELINFCFNGGDKEYIGIYRGNGVWTNDQGKYNITFNKKNLKLAINYLLDNCYFTLGSLCFRQIVGIPMGSDPAPFMANLFLYHYERKWLLKFSKKDLRKARTFSNIFRYIDDLCSINNTEFEKNYKEIYPEELALKKENLNPYKASFLDVSIQVQSNKTFSIKLFDKRDAFPFYINRMPYIDSNIPSKIFYACIGSEILRIARTTSEKNDMIHCVNQLIIRMKKQGSQHERFISLLKKIYGKHFSVFKKFASTADCFIKLFTF